MALALVRAGVDVLITGARSAGELDRTTAEAQALGKGRCFGRRADVSDAGHCVQVQAEAVERFGRVDILVNNAARGPTDLGGAAPDGGRPRFWEADSDAYQRMIDANVTGPFFMARCCAPAMVAAGHGRIINISTSRPTMLIERSGPYGATKAMLEASSRTWASELAGTGVTVNVLLPGGPADTALIPGAVGERSNRYRAGKEPLGQEGIVTGGLLPPELMVPPLLWLASDDAADVTGRRFIARDWDPDLHFAAALVQAEGPRTSWPHVI
jgi:3-oxoacyl-[acyl-carrier protein] reductase